MAGTGKSRFFKPFFFLFSLANFELIQWAQGKEILRASKRRMQGKDGSGPRRKCGEKRERSDT